MQVSLQNILLSQCRLQFRHPLSYRQRNLLEIREHTDHFCPDHNHFWPYPLTKTVNIHLRSHCMDQSKLVTCNGSTYYILKSKRNAITITCIIMKLEVQYVNQHIACHDGAPACPLTHDKKNAIGVGGGGGGGGALCFLFLSYISDSQARATRHQTSCAHSSM